MDRVTVIEARLRAALMPEHIEITDESAAHAGHAGARGGAGHYALTIVSPQFKGQTAIARHRMIYQALGELMHHEIHALRINALTPEEQ
ncbi:MAG: BolA family transcriptional regulator [Gammaproteobacteria bacterium]|nr:BolA family transcriptional regulator [Gammaproteobacteria bacterium]